jgi:hypothetical protein
VIYLDSCALVKLVRTEDGSSALQEWLDERSRLSFLERAQGFVEG